jgi:hypothetical protein
LVTLPKWKEFSFYDAINGSSAGAAGIVESIPCWKCLKTFMVFDGFISPLVHDLAVKQTPDS